MNVMECPLHVPTMSQLGYRGADVVGSNWQFLYYGLVPRNFPKLGRTPTRIDQHHGKKEGRAERSARNDPVQSRALEEPIRSIGVVWVVTMERNRRVWIHHCTRAQDKSYTPVVGSVLVVGEQQQQSQ